MTRLGWAVAAALLATHAVLAYLVRSPGITTGNDDALYLLLARSLRSLHYLDSHIIGAPMHAQYPPGFPAFLAPFGENFHAAIIGGIVVSTAGLLLTYDLARRAIGPVPALLVLAALAVNPALVNWAGSLRSESLFMASSIAAIWCASRTAPGTGWLMAAGIFAVYAAMVRSAGVALVCALLLTWLIQRRLRAATLFAGFATLVVGGWLVLTAVAPGQLDARSYAAALKRAESAPTTVGVVMNRIEASFTYLYKYIPSSLSVPSVEGTSVDNAFWTLLLGVGLVAGLFALWRKFPIITAFLVIYAGILTLYPFKMTRFLIPIVPLLVLTATSGLVIIARRFTGRGPLLATALLCFPLLAGAAGRDRGMIRDSARCTAPSPWGPTSCSTPSQLGFFAVAEYARTKTPPAAVFLTLKEATFALLTDRRVQHPERVIRADTLNLTQTMRSSGVNYVVISPIHPSRLSRLLARRCAELQLEQAFPSDTYLLRVLPDSSSGRGAACQILDRLAKDSRFTPRDELGVN